MTDEDCKKVQIHLFTDHFANMLSDLRKMESETEMLEDMVIYNTGKTLREIRIIYRTYIRKDETYFQKTDENYMKFLSDCIDCNFDIDALVAINEL